MQEIFPGLYAISRAGTLCYLLESAPDELTVIDTGMPGTTSAILKAVRSLGKQASDIKHILITHADIDHVGSLAGLAKATGATVYASEESKPYIEAAKPPPHLPAVMQIFTPMMGLMQKKVTVNTTFSDNETLDIADGILALHTPGHTPENYNFYWRREKTLFAADLFFAFGSSLTLTPSRISWSPERARESAIKVLDLAPTYICPGHGRIVNLEREPEVLVALERKLEGSASLAAT
ncbi:MAG: MBL fold metallo-hydrolase [Chloroflexota bacterium]